MGPKREHLCWATWDTQLGVTSVLQSRSLGFMVETLGKKDSYTSHSEESQGFGGLCMPPPPTNLYSSPASPCLSLRVCSGHGSDTRQTQKKP